MTSIYNVLKASKGIHVDDTFAELWGRKLSNAYTVATYTGTLPATLQTASGYLESYKIFGNASGVGVETENLFDAATAYGSMYDSATGVLVGAASTLTSMRNKFDSSMVGVPITISVHADDVSVTRVYIRCTINGTNIDSNAIASNKTGTMTVTVTPTSVNDDWRITFGTGTGNLTLSNIMLNTGSAALPYEPYGYKLPIISNSTVTNIYLGEVETTRKIKKLVLTGEENWNNSDSYPSHFRLYLTGTVKIAPICTHYRGSNSSAYSSIGNGYCSTSAASNTQLVIHDNVYTTISNFKSYLAAQYANGTPVTIWYVLAEPETGIVNEPLMKIGDYADTIDSEQTAVQIPTAAGNTVIDYAGEGLAPSEVELTYRKQKG